MQGKAPVLGFVAAFSMASLVGWTASADEVADFYKGKNISLIVGHEAGTGYDAYGRALIRHMGRHIPGNPAMVAQNMPGASGLNAANWLYNVAEKDGTVMATFANTAPFEPLIGRGTAKFDPVRFNWIGNMDESIGVCIVSNKAGIDTFDDLFTTEVMFGGTSPTGPFSQLAYALKNLLGAQINLIEGYSGGRGIRLELARGEFHGLCGVSLSTLQTQWISEMASGDLKIIAQLSGKRQSDLQGVAYIHDYAKTEDDHRVFELVFGRHALGRPVVAPPDVSADRTNALRSAFMDTMNDKAFLADAEKTQLDILPSSGEDVEDLFVRFFSFSQAVIDRANQAVRRN